MTDLNRSSREGVSPTLCRGLPLAGNGNTRLSGKKKEKNMASKLVIREGVTEIREGQHKHSKIEELVLPSTLKKIGKEAFALCYNLKKVVIPDNCTIIGEEAFYDCSSLECLDLGKG